MLDFSKGDGWITAEDSFDSSALGKAEAVMALGNGYMDLRSATEEQYIGETRDLLIAGTFDRFSEEEVTELPNAADVTNIELTLNGERFDLTHGKILSYERSLNMKTGLLSRRVEWQSDKGDIFDLAFERIVSMKRIHTIAMRITIVPAQDTAVQIRSGIDGRMSCDGSQHFTEGQMRFYDKKYLQFVPRTIQSGISFVVDAVHNFTVDDEAAEPSADINILRRHMFSKFNMDVKAGQTAVMEKIANVYTTRDLDAGQMSVGELQDFALEQLKADEQEGFDALSEESAAAWNEKVWDRAPVEIKGPDFDQLAVRFAQYHMALMVPAHDNRMNIGAKGLTGEGYKGHVFWDTEVFLLPYYIFCMPDIARNLEEYRYKSLPGAHRKAEGNGYRGAQYPWESAWLDDGEVTPEYMGTDIHTGKSIKVWSGIIEIHITSDVAYGVWNYYQCTGDEDFMESYGYEIIFDCAAFWESRLEAGDDDLWHINDVVGPDEYKEHVNDNAFTNYMAKWTMDLAVEYGRKLKEHKPNLYKQLNDKMNLDKMLADVEFKAEKIFLTRPNEEGVLPQDSTYLTLPDVDLTKYKKQAHVGGIYKDYNQEQITKMQVSKQADVMVLFFLLEDLFSHDVKVRSFHYYEPRCLHDSSLSLCTHSLLAADSDEVGLGYDMFKRACLIDLDNAAPHSSDAGIHAASCGGIWQCAVQGFGGLRMLGGRLRISPNLPDEWDEIKYTFMWKGQRVSVLASRNSVEIQNLTGDKKIEVEVWGKQYDLTDKLTVTR